MNSIIPVPESVHLDNGSFALRDEAVIAIPKDRRGIREVAELFVSSTDSLTGLSFVVRASHSGDIVLAEQDGLDPEGYKLHISSDRVEIAASAPTGFFYALQSFAQLLPLGATSAELPCLHIRDKPRFPWRGVLIDSARRFIPKPEIMKILDTIARYKINRFHWHLTDDQGWRLEIRKYPELTVKRARLDRSDLQPEGWFYTQSDIREIIAYAAARGITVVPEIEMPGHSAAILDVMPDLRCQSADAPRDPSDSNLSNVYCAGNEKTFSIVEDILEEVFSLFGSEFVHIGGDEATKDHWKRCPRCQSRMAAEGLAGTDELQSYFIKRVERIFKKHNRRLVGWDEIMDGGLARSAALMYWRSEEGDESLGNRLLDAAQRGHQIVMTPQTHCYFDYHQDREWSNEPSGAIGTVTLGDAYAFDPIPKGLAETEYQNILGGQCNMWNDTTLGLAGLEYMLYPRLFALAEAVWSPPENRDYRSLLRRIPAHLRRLAALGVNSRYPDGIAFVYENGALALEPELPGARIHVSRDGREPTEDDEMYEQPITTTAPALVRAAIVTDSGSLGRVKSFTVAD